MFGPSESARLFPAFHPQHLDLRPCPISPEKMVIVALETDKISVSQVEIAKAFGKVGINSQGLQELCRHCIEHGKEEKAWE